MNDVNETAAGSANPSDEENRHLFGASLDPYDTDRILGLKRDDPNVMRRRRNLLVTFLAKTLA